MKKQIFDWFSESLKTINNFGDVKDIHINEFSDVVLKHPEDYLKVSCSILRELSLIAKNFDLSDFRLDLNIELKESNSLKGKPLNLKSIIEEIDTYSIPEILIYKPIPDHNLSLPTVEFYRTPVLFKICEDVENFKIFYEEYRNYDNIDEEEDFSRWLSFVYVCPVERRL